MTRIALGLEYHGGPYCGWQSQPSGCGVQDHLEKALAAFAGTGELRVAVTCAGRTDTGVHAALQVVHLDTSLIREAEAWVRGCNAHLPATIRVLWAKPVDEEFHARFSARTRTYQYVLLNDRTAPAAMHGTVGWFHPPLDEGAMREAATHLIGEHDFSTFRAAECQAKSPVKHMHSVEISRNGAVLTFSFRANAFLHHMIRNIVGELVYVGAGRRSLKEFQTIFASRQRALAAPTFAPDGLYLTQIEYDARFDLPTVAARIPYL